jgi:diguanylate cyclase (GGDEF)-like protein
VRASGAKWLLGIGALLWAALALATEPASRSRSPLRIQVLAAAEAPASAAAVTSGTLDSHFTPVPANLPQDGTRDVWLKLQAVERFRPPTGVPVIVIRRARGMRTEVFAPAPGGGATPLSRALDLPEFGGLQDAVFIAPEGLTPDTPLYARVDLANHARPELGASISTLQATLNVASEHTRMIALVFGALLAMALTALLMWFVLSDKLLLVYGTLFSLQAVYIAYLSGQGFDWPLLSYATYLASFAWNVPVSLSGAAASLFIREIADLRHYSPRAYRVLGWFAVAFVLSAASNLARLVGLGAQVAVVGNLLFIASGVFVLTVALLAWRRGSRAAGWFLIAWTLLESFTIGTAVYMLFATTDEAERLLYYGLPLSMATAAVLVALGVADRLREQRHALSEAERRAMIDPLTGALNRRSLIERLETLCMRAQSRKHPIALLFIDVDHFKSINDSYGHAAGDACLAALIPAIQAELRQSDVIGRYGGEEFVVILSSADLAAAHPIAERICKRVSDLRVEGFGKPIRLTCSIGVAASDPLGVWGEALIAKADAAVYEAKRCGRNCVQLAVPLAA